MSDRVLYLPEEDPGSTPRVEDPRLAALRAFAHNMARLASDLTVLTFTVPTPEVAIQQQLDAMRVHVETAHYL